MKFCQATDETPEQKLIYCIQFFGETGLQWKLQAHNSRFNRKKKTAMNLFHFLH